MMFNCLGIVMLVTHNYFLLKLNVNYRLNSTELMGKSNGDNELYLMAFKTLMVFVEVLF